MKEVVESIVRALVSSPEEVDIEEIEGGPTQNFLRSRYPGRM
jgi:predicted RNA-binding protein YlqC (UPF0109 family)